MRSPWRDRGIAIETRRRLEVKAATAGDQVAGAVEAAKRKFENRLTRDRGLVTRDRGWRPAEFSADYLVSFYLYIFWVFSDICFPRLFIGFLG